MDEVTRERDERRSSTMASIHLIPDDIRERFECHEWRNAAAVLREAHNSEWDDVMAMLRAFTLPRSSIVEPGNSKSKVSKWVDEFLGRRGWVETGFETAILVDNERRPQTNRGPSPLVIADHLWRGLRRNDRFGFQEGHFYAHHCGTRRCSRAPRY